MVQDISGGALTNGQIHFTLPPNGLPPGQIATVTITLLASPTTLPSSTLYATSAKGDFILSSASPVTITETSKFEINAAILSVKQEVTPTPPVPFGSSFTVTLTITNIGNAKAQITAGKFVDYWTTDFVRISSISDSRFLTVENTIINTSTLNLQPEESMSFQFKAQLLVPPTS